MACESCPNEITARPVLTTAAELDELPEFSVGAIKWNGLPVGKDAGGMWFVVGYDAGITAGELIDGAPGGIILLSRGKAIA